MASFMKLFCVMLLAIALGNLAKSEFNRCEIAGVVSPQDGEFTYWLYVHRHKNHGVCANVYDGHDSGWIVELPDAPNPTALYSFDTQGQAFSWAGKHCSTSRWE